MDYMLEPPEPSKKEQWVEDRVEQLIDEGNLERFSWFEDCIDWDKVCRYLDEIASKEYEDMIGEAQIEAWENKQRWND